MSKQAKRPKDSKERLRVSLREAAEGMDKYAQGKKEMLEFEVKYFFISVLVLASTNIYIHKANLSNYDFKVMALVVLYFARRILRQVWYAFRVREHMMLPLNRLLVYVATLQIALNVGYFIYDLASSYSFYNLLPLFYFVTLQVPMFYIDLHRRYENAGREMMHIIKKILYLSVEVCYYGIFIPVFFSMKYSPFLNVFAIIVYTSFTWVNCAALLFAFHYYKKSGELHFYSRVWGNWARVRRCDIPPEKFQKIKSWTGQVYERFSVVEFKGKYYMALEERNYVEPNNLYANWLHALFADPKKIFWRVLLFQGWFTIFQLLFYLFTQLNIFSLNLSIMSWYIFFSVYRLSKKIKFIFNK